MNTQSILGVCTCMHSQFYMTLCNPMDGSPPGASVSWSFPGKNTEVGCHSLGVRQDIFLTWMKYPSHWQSTLCFLSCLFAAVWWLIFCSISREGCPEHWTPRYCHWKISTTLSNWDSGLFVILLPVSDHFSLCWLNWAPGKKTWSQTLELGGPTWSFHTVNSLPLIGIVVEGFLSF